MRVKVTLACGECKQRNYNTIKNKKNDPDRIEMNKYCPFCKKHTLHKETKQLEVLEMAKENAKNIGKETKKRNLAAQQPKKKTSVKDYFKGIRIEMKKVVWPTKKELGSYTAVVILTCAVFALAFWAIDSGFLALLKAVLNIELQ